MGRNQHIYSLETILRMSHDVRKQGGRVVLTHGAFDLFHIGHLHMLKESAKHGDFLIVGVDSDESIKKYKHVNRPVISEQDRLEIISQIQPVDAVFMIDTKVLGNKEAFRNLYKEVGAEVITIGRNYFAEEAIHNDIHGLKGTKVVKIDNDLESTTRILKRISETL